MIPYNRLKGSEEKAPLSSCGIILLIEEPEISLFSSVENSTDDKWFKYITQRDI